MPDERPCTPETPCARCEELEAEVKRLREEVVHLREANAALLRAGIDRDYERPPHYL